MAESATVVRTEHLLRLMSRLWANMSGARRRQCGLLLASMVLAAFAELLSIGSVLPFLAALTQPKAVFASPVVAPFLQRLAINNESELIVLLTAVFALATILACLIRLAVLWGATRFAFAFGSDIGNQVYRSALYQSYEVHTARNSGEVINAIWGQVNEVVFYILIPSMGLFTSAIVALVICLAFAVAVPAPAFVALGILVLVYLVIIKLSRTRLKRNSQRVAEGSTNVVKALQEGLGGIRDIIIDGSQEVFLANYRRVNQELRSAQGQNQIISLGPRYLLEAMGMLLIATLAYSLTMHKNGGLTAIPILAAIALGLQRLMPAAQLMFASWSTIYGSQASLRDVLRLLDAPLPEVALGPRAQQPMPFTRDIRLRAIAYRHRTDSAWVFEHIDLRICKGDRVGFVGATGGGKSTLLNLLMGLLTPSSGQIEIDGVPVTAQNRSAWQKRIAHVPQSVFLADCSVEENIAFGIPMDEIDHARVVHAASQAQLAELINTWPQGYQTGVGERGVQLSGGQRQRIGIARALYKKADVIVFDEATSALDNVTERCVMDAIESLGDHITVLIIAHRLNTLRSCTEIYEVGHGTVKRKSAGVAV